MCTSKEEIKLSVRDEFVCPECGEPLQKVEKKGINPKVIAGCALAAVLLGGGGAAYFLTGDSSEAKGISLDKQTRELAVGMSDTLRATVNPTDAKATLRWASSDASVIKVENGVVTAVAPGSAKVGVQIEEKKELKAFCDYTVKGTSSPGTVASGGSDNAMSALSTGHVEEENEGVGSISTPFGKYKGDLKDGKAEGNGTFQFFKACRISGRDGQQRMAEAGDYITGQFAGNEIVNVKWFAKDGTQKGVIMIGKTGV
ncbi:MAG: Ig domain-containing protein [Parabacteroides sp.]